MEIFLRSVQIHDAPALAKLSHQLGYPVNQEVIRRRVSEILQHPDHYAFVALANEMIVGWIHGFYTLRVESDPFMEVGGLVVDEHSRNKGIGKALVRQIMKWAADRGVNKLRVRSNSRRKDSHAFYGKLGFIKTKEQKIFDILL